MSKIIITIDHDHDVDDPGDYDGWSVHSFSTQHSNYKDPADLGLDADGDPDCPDLLRKLKEGLAFRLSYFEHGQCMWSLQGTGPQCRWDNVQLAGLLIWEGADDDIGATTVEDRQKDAASFLDQYTKWCNGYTFCYRSTKVRDCHACGQEEEVQELDGCGGFIGHEYLFEHIQENMDLDGETVEFRGEAGGYLADYYKELVG